MAIDIDIAYGIHAFAPDLADGTNGAGIVDSALSDHAPVLAAARRKAVFLREKDADGTWADCEAAVSDKLRPVRTGPAIDTLAGGYAGLPVNGLLPNDGGPFEMPIERCADIGARANRPRTGDGSVG